MEETKRNSMKLDIEAVRVSENDHDLPTEKYKQVSEFSSNEKSTELSNQAIENMTREKGDNVEDGADEKMLDTDGKQQLARKDEVKFIPSDRSNGDAKIDIGNIEKTFTGMTKEELMKYANDPFWQRLRWIFFILFWLLWAAMLAGAIWIILKAPKCSEHKPLSWYKEGPLFVMPKKNVVKVDDKLIEKLKSVTPNYVTKDDDDLFQRAKENETLRQAFLWQTTTRIPNNWLSKEGPSDTTDPNANTAWHKIQTNTYVLSQFGAGKIDLQLSNPIAKEKFKNVLREIAQKGVKGFRLANAKHYIINPEAPDEKSISQVSGAVHTEYSFWAHTHSTNLPGIGELLNEFSQVVNNETKGEGFLSVTDLIESPDLSIVPHPSDTKTIAENLYNKLSALEKRSTWQQWPIGKLAADSSNGTSAYNTFIFLLPGVPVGSIQDLLDTNNGTINEIKELEKLRKSPSYQHGTFTCHLGNDKTVIWPIICLSLSLISSFPNEIDSVRY